MKIFNSQSETNTKRLFNPTIDTLLFDLDGTLVDTSKANISAYKQAFSDLNLSFNQEKYLQNFGLRFDSMMKTLMPKMTSNQSASIKALKSKYYKESMELITPNSKLINFLKLNHNKHKTGLCTTASKVNVESVLKHIKIKSYFDIIITGEDVTYSKPDPECYLLAMKKLNSTPNRTVIFEDSEVGIQAAKNSLAEPIFVTTFLNKESILTILDKHSSPRHLLK